MTYRDSGDRRAAHRPQHAARPGFTGPMPSNPIRVQGSHLHTREPGREAIAVGAWVTVLCLAVGVITVATSLATRDPGSIAAPHLRGRSAPSVTSPALQQSRPQVLALFSGHGDQTTRRFSVRAGVRWQLRWEYRCPAGQQTGEFIVDRTDIGPGEMSRGASIKESAPIGKGSTWLKAGGAIHSLVVISTCTWTMQVVQASLPPRAPLPQLSGRAPTQQRDRAWRRRGRDWFRKHGQDWSWVRQSGHWPWSRIGHSRWPAGQRTAEADS